MTTSAEANMAGLTQVDSGEPARQQMPHGLAIVGEVSGDGETATVMPTIPSARFEATNVDHFERRAAHRDSAEKTLDHLYRIRARLLDLDDEGRLDACSAARLGDVEAEIAAIQESRAVRVRETDPGWARLEELARQVLAAADPPTPDSQ